MQAHLPATCSPVAAGADMHCMQNALIAPQKTKQKNSCYTSLSTAPTHADIHMRVCADFSGVKMLDVTGFSEAPGVLQNISVFTVFNLWDEVVIIICNDITIIRDISEV